MAKKKRDSNSGSKRDKKLQSARQRLEEAEQLYAEAQRRGEQAMERVRVRAERWVAVAAARVGRRTAALERAQHRLRPGPPATTSQDGDSDLAIVEIPVEKPAGIIVLAGREALALQALRRVDHDGGVTAQEWRSA